jgi:hypothetical protein
MNYRNKDIAADRYWNVYNAENVYDLDWFDEVFKRKSKKSRFGDNSTFADDDHINNYKGNKDLGYVRALDRQDFDNNFQIGRSLLLSFIIL